MMTEDDKKSQIFMFAQRTTGVSKALWPAKIRRIVATDKAAQRRRSRIASKEWQILPSIPRTPETPLPTVPAGVRVLETIDLSRFDVEHFLDIAKH